MEAAFFCALKASSFKSRKEIIKMSRAVTDHEGHNFRSMAEMCEYHNIGYRVVLRRLERGSTIEEALTKPVVEVPKRASMSEKERAKLYQENHKAEIKEYQARYRAKKRMEKNSVDKGKKTMDLLLAWHEIMSAINTNFQNLTEQEFERLNLEDLLIEIDDIRLENAVVVNPFLWHRGNEYLKQKKQELVFEKFIAEETEDKKGKE